MLASPAISIIVAAYNAESTIQCCIESMLSQSFADFELIVVDDQSTDQTRNMIQQCAAIDQRVQYFRNENGKGASAARNAGLDQAKGKYILFLDADDWMLSTAMEEFLNTARHTDDALIVSAHVQYRGKDAQHLNHYGYEAETRFEGQGLLDCLFDYLDKPYQNVMLVHCWGKLFRRDIIARHGIRFELSLSQLEDLNFVFSYMRHIKSFSFIPTGLYFHRIEIGAHSMSTKTGMDARTPEKFTLALSTLETCLNAFWPDHQIYIRRRVGGATASLLILAILRLCRAFVRNPGREIYQCIRAIARSSLFHEKLLSHRPLRDEALLLYAACRTGVPALVLVAGVLRIYMLRVRSSLLAAFHIPKQAAEPATPFLTIADAK